MDEHSAHCLVNLRPIYEGRRHIGCIMMLRPIEQVRRLVHQQIGVEANLSIDDIANSSQSAPMRRVLRKGGAAASGS